MFDFQKFLAQQIDSKILKLSTPPQDFIPYACHYDKDTILTKNGELLQTIKISGFSYENNSKKQSDLRESLKKAVLESIAHEKMAIYFHTIRQKRNLSPGGKYDNVFIKKNNSEWIKKNCWHEKYVNELYITLITEGLPFHISNVNDFFSALAFSPLNRKHTAHLEKSLGELYHTADNIIVKLQDYGAAKLSVEIDEQGAHSELLKFLNKIIHLDENRVPLPLVDLSKYISDVSLMTFAMNKFEIKRKNHDSHFGSILSIKEYHHFTPAAIDRFMQLPVQFVITQAMHFIPYKHAVKDFEYAAYVMTVSGDAQLYRASGLEKFFTGTNSDRAYVKQQTTIMLIEEDVNKLDDIIKRAYHELSRLGILCVLEDLHLEQCFFAQLPANFSFLSRQSPIVATNIAGFASIQNSPTGDLNTIWGKAITILRSDIGTPYFFNFHVGKIGHSFIFGPDNSGKSTTGNFLLSETCKYDPKMFIIDSNGTSNIFCKAIGARYEKFSFNHEQNLFKFNPLLLPDNQSNRMFLSSWFLSLFINLNEEINEQDKLLAADLVNKLYQLSAAERRLSKFVLNLGELAQPDLIDKLAPWHGDGKYAAIFDNEEDHFDLTVKLQAFDVTDLLASDEQAITAYIYYCFFRFNLMLDGKPALFVLDKAILILDNKFLSQGVNQWLDYLTQHNAIVLFKDAYLPTIKNPELIDILRNKVVTQMFLSDRNLTSEVANKYYGLNKEELITFRSMNPDVPGFMLKQENYAIIVEINLFGMRSILEILSSDAKTTLKMQEAIAKTSDNPESWLPIYDKYFEKS